MQLPECQTIAFNRCDLDGTRTHDSLIKSQVLYRLSYEINAILQRCFVKRGKGKSSTL